MNLCGCVWVVYCSFEIYDIWINLLRSNVGFQGDTMLNFKGAIGGEKRDQHVKITVIRNERQVCFYAQIYASGI